MASLLCWNLEWIKKQFKLLQEKSEQSNKLNGKEQKKKKPFEDSSSDDEDDLTPNLTNSQNKVKRKVMDSSSSDEEKAKDKGEEEANLYYNSVCDPSLSGLLFNRCGHVVRDFESEAKTRCNFQF